MPSTCKSFKYSGGNMDTHARGNSKDLREIDNRIIEISLKKYLLHLLESKVCSESQYHSECKFARMCPCNLLGPSATAFWIEFWHEGILSVLDMLYIQGAQVQCLGEKFAMSTPVTSSAFAATSTLSRLMMAWWRKNTLPWWRRLKQKVNASPAGQQCAWETVDHNLSN